MNVHTPCPPPAPVNIHTLFTPYKQLSASSEMQSQYCVTMDTSTLAPKLPYLRYAHMRAHVKHTIVESGKSTIMSSSTVAVVNKSRKSTSWWAHARAETGSQIMPNDGPCACRLLLSHACVYKSDLQTIYNSQLFPYMQRRQQEDDVPADRVRQDLPCAIQSARITAGGERCPVYARPAAMAGSRTSRSRACVRSCLP